MVKQHVLICFVIGLDEKCEQSEIAYVVSCNQEDILSNYLTNRNTTSAVTVESLFPGKKYNCSGTITYTNFANITINSTGVQIETKKFDFNVTPKTFQIDIHFDNSRNWNLTFYYKSQSASYRQVSINKTLASELTIDNLDMATNYTICLALEHILKCPDLESECQKCENTQTNEAKPFPPSNIQITETQNKKLKVMWEKPQTPSGVIVSYHIVIEGHCIASDPKACSTSGAACQAGTSKQENVGPDIYNYFYDVQPYWSYQVFVSATNSQGDGENIAGKINTTSELHYPTIQMKTDKKKLTIFLTPRCPYTGPATFKVSVKGTDPFYSDSKTVKYDSERFLNMERPIVFDNLTPAKEYQVCISALPPSPPPECSSTTTIQIPPEGYPYLTESFTDTITIKLRINRPENAHPLKNELLTYYFKMAPQCQYYDGKCSYYSCTEEEIWKQKKSGKPWFDFVASELKPYWMYKFQLMLGNKAGNGTWSHWTNWFNTTQITDQNLLPKTIFSPSSSDNSIGIHLHPMCPYMGKLFYKV